jgi:hypothetical protein
MAAILTPAAPAEPIRLDESGLRTVVVDGQFGPQMWQATDWLRGAAWLDLAAPISRIRPLPELRPSQPSSPQTIRRFDFGHSTGDGMPASPALWLHLSFSALSANE